MSNEIIEMENANTNGENGKQTLTLIERIKRIPVKKVLKVAGIIGGSIAGTIVLGKITSPKELDYTDYDDAPFDGKYEIQSSEEEQSGN